ncbi:hypothetical protein [Polaribacter porphyrae]|uniref:Uncharacterized protein n=1 Tax=Polaribacter porphyrae TaxID=1137780 RepID=A0A2S7WKG0_9FLAO|nr:hypothetical protein [Polaribacter porphyrae]PQJ77926.1 hypothetical protein BTO18_01425 [Polaribacter porphyrae]
MKNLKSIIAILAISLSTVFSVNATEKESEKEYATKVTKQLRTEIVSMLGTKIQLELKSDTKAEVSFMINSKNEVVVISVDCKLTEFNSFVKSKLNYKKIDVKGVKKGEIYKIPVKINAA